VSAEISVSSVLIADMRPQSMLLPVFALVDEEIVETQALLDSGAGGEFMDHSFAQRHNLPLYKLPRKIITRNVDGTKNSQGKVTHETFLDLTVNGEQKKTRFYVTGLGKDTLILGLPWLRENNPIVNWAEGTIRSRWDRGREIARRA
jgi:hypothetical protein